MIFAVLPAYNEAENLPALLNALDQTMRAAGLPYKAIIVDDGSTDATERVARGSMRNMPILLVSHETNLGLPEAARTGLLKVLEESKAEDVIVTMDADNTHDPAQIVRMARMTGEGYDVVVASRYRKGSIVIGVPLMRRFLSFGASVLFRLLFPVKGVKDYTSGYRAYRAKVIKDMFDAYGDDFIDQPGFACIPDMLLKLRRYPVKMGEIPLVLRYDLRYGKSKMDVPGTVRDTLRLAWRRFFERDILPRR